MKNHLLKVAFVAALLLSPFKLSPAVEMGNDSPKIEISVKPVKDEPEGKKKHKRKFWGWVLLILGGLVFFIMRGLSILWLLISLGLIGWGVYLLFFPRESK